MKKNNINAAFYHVADEWNELYYLEERGCKESTLDIQRARAMEGLYVLELLTGKGFYYNFRENAIKEV